jgi:putative transposase
MVERARRTRTCFHWEKRCKWPNTLSCCSARKGPMTETLVEVSPPPKDSTDPRSAEELAAARELVRQARTQGVALTGPGGLLKALTKTVIETALEMRSWPSTWAMTNMSGAAGTGGNSRNGKRAKTVLDRFGHVEVAPRDR